MLRLRKEGRGKVNTRRFVSSEQGEWSILALIPESELQLPLFHNCLVCTPTGVTKSEGHLKRLEGHPSCHKQNEAPPDN